MDKGKAACSSSGQSSSTQQYIKREPRGPPSPTPSLATTVAHPRTRGPPSPTPSFASTVAHPPSRGACGTLSQASSTSTEKCSISVKPLASLMDPDDQLSVVSNADLETENERVKITSNFQDEPAKDWRVQFKSVRERLHYILENENKYQDVVFEVHGKTSRKLFPAHKLILRIASMGFDKLFKEADCALNSSKSEDGTTIIVKNIEPEIFQFLLKFMYTDEIEMTNLKSEEILQLLQAARMYEVTPLYFECVQMLKNEISDDVAIQLCEMGASYDDSLLLETALKHIASKAFDIFPSENFLQLSSESICRLIERDDLHIDETSLFEAIIHWAESKCMHGGIAITSFNLRQTLQNIIPKVRFPLMNAQEFTLRVAPTKILTSEEQVEVYQYLSVEPSKRDKLPAISFNTKPRRSKKSFAFERDDSLSDYQENSSNDNSPVRTHSVANPDCADITTTEPDSETASIVSTSSGNRKRARKYERSLSSDCVKKRSKDEKVHRKPSTTSQLNDLFGDPNDHIISIEDKTVSLNTFISECSRNERRGSVEVIKMTNVKIDDFKKLEGHKVRFPNLKEFNLNVHIDESINSVLPEIPVENLLFFSTSKKIWSFEDLWSMNVNITLIINRIIVLKISPNVNHITLNKFSGAPVVLKSLRDCPLKSIVYSHTQFLEKTFPDTLRRLVLLGMMSYSINDFLLRFKHLKNLTIIPPTPINKELKVLEFKENFMSKDKLRKLGLGPCKLELGSSVRFRSMEGLYMWRTSWDSHFEEKVHLIFPNLKEFFLIGPMKGSAKLLKNITKIQTLSQVFSWACEWRLMGGQDAAEMRKFMASCQLSDADKNFALKRDEVGRWKGNKISFQASQEQIYSKLDYDFIYEDFSCFFK